MTFRVPTDVATRITDIAYPSEGGTINGIGNPQEEAMTPEGPGRPPVGPMVNVRLPQELIDGLDRMAQSHDLSRAALIRIVLEDVVEGHRTAHLTRRLLEDRHD